MSWYKPKRSYSGDPHWIDVRYTGKCSKCSEVLKKGQRAFYYPNGKHLYCQANGCATAAESDFLTMAQAEDHYGF